MPLRIRLSAGQLRDYVDLLEHLSELVLTAIKRHDQAAVRRWTSSLAHVGNVVLDEQAHCGLRVA